MKNLHNSKDEILTRLRTVQPTSQRCWGKMSAHQMVCHLADSLRGPMGQRSISRRSPPLPRKLIKWLALNLPMRWPHGVKGPPEIDQQLGGTRPQEFTADMHRLLQLLDEFTSQPRAFSWGQHPVFDDMTDEEWMRWGYLHTDHHLRQFGA